jgi:hypothetical protein
MHREDSPPGGPPQGAAETARLRALFEPALSAAVVAMDVGAEAILFAPDGRLFLVCREGLTTFRARELESRDEATDAVLRWQAEARQAEAVT